MTLYQVRHYLTSGESKDVYVEWLRHLRDASARIHIIRRVARAEQGNLVITNFAVMVSGSYAWTLARAIASTTQYRADKSCFCFVVVTNARRMQIAIALWPIGKTGNGEATMRSRSSDDAMAELYREDPALAIEVINAILEDGDQGELLVVLRQLAQAFGGVQAVAEHARLNPTQLYRTLSAKGNPALSSLAAILKAMGLRLAVLPIEASSQQLTAP